jgi:hypothetical protein
MRGIVLTPILWLGFVVGCGCNNDSTAPPPPPPPPPQFNSTDRTETEQWLAALPNAYRRAKKAGNPLAIEEAEKQLHAALAEIKGKPVRWRLPIKRFDRDSVQVNPEYGLDSKTWLELHLYSADQPSGTPGLHLYPEKDLSREYFRKLTRNSLLTIEGKIHDAVFKKGLLQRDSIILTIVSCKAVEATP